jgi:choline-sulfatase
VRRAILVLLLAAAVAAAVFAWRSRDRRPPDLVVLTIDTLRADHVGAYGSSSGATPNLDAFAKESVLFETAITAAPLTLPAHTALFSGVLPFRNGVRVNGTDVVADTVPLVAAELKALGWDTAAFVSSLVLRQPAGLSRGFTTYDDRFSANEGKNPRDQVPERPGDETVARALSWLSERKTSKDRPPFFLWVHLYDPHTPYEPPADLAARFPKSPYDGEIAFADVSAGRLLAALDPARTAVVVAGDHGESLGEHGEATHGVFLYDATLRVPLLLRLPKRAHAAMRVTTQVRLVDVAATLRRLAGAPEVAGDGEDLSPLLDVRSATRFPRPTTPPSSSAGRRRAP